MPDPVAPLPDVQVAVAIVFRAGRVLICRRPPGVPLAGYWEFPGGKCHPGESAEQTALRELSEETGVVAVAASRLPTVTHAYSHAHVRLTPVLCHWQQGSARPLSATKCVWTIPSALRRYPFPAANAALMRSLCSSTVPPAIANAYPADYPAVPEGD